MDILTPKGQESAKSEVEAASLFCSIYDCYQYVHSPKDKPCVIDAVLVRDSCIHAVVEMKCRTMSIDEFRNRFKSRWLVTASKIDGAVEMAGLLCVPLVSMVYLIPSKTLLVKKIWEDGKYLVDIERHHSITQRTINGGVANRLNAYVDLSRAKEIR